MAYAQWIVMNFAPKGFNASIKDAKVDWGKFHQPDNKDKEIDKSEINKIVIDDNAQRSIAACGRSNAASGTEGSLDIYDGSTKIASFYWDCPWSSKTNKFVYTKFSTQYIIDINPSYTFDSGALGTATITIVKL